ncbi:MAG TPA: imidazole glycerol phosphate synthase subunit HisH [Gemmatimonadaceae bacterium]|nr:imidazole glycerol phosphate synthase subunit HisH [Gemmatimonadaceae bacterium]
MSGPCVAVIETGAANLASVLAAFQRLGTPATTTSDPDRVRTADRVVLPGVGAFGDVMRRLRSRGLADAIVERCDGGRPVLAVCLGLQLLAERSDEAPEEQGLAVFAGTVTRFAPPLKVPQLGWNLVSAATASRVIESGHAYFANSYRLDEAPSGWTASWATHGAPFVAALERGSLLACQFHPELSGRWGAALLARWITRC